MWPSATDGEREEILQALVIRVEMTEKETGACELSLLHGGGDPAPLGGSEFEREGE